MKPAIIALLATTMISPAMGQDIFTRSSPNVDLDAEIQQSGRFAGNWTGLNMRTVMMASIDESSITPSYMMGNILAEAIPMLAQHPTPGLGQALGRISRTLPSALQTEKDKANLILNIAEAHLASIGDIKNATIISKARIANAKSTQKDASTFVLSISQDLRKAGALQPSKYLNNQSIMIESDIASIQNAILDAAALAMRFGASPQPGISELLAQDLAGIDVPATRNMILDLLANIQARTGDQQFSRVSQRIRDFGNQNGADIYKNAITQAKRQVADNKPRSQ